MSASSTEPVPTGTISRDLLHHQVAEKLQELIVQGELPPGTRLNERVLCERFDISRTPLREAIKTLSAEGLVQLLPNRGAVVTQVTLVEAEDMFQIMAVLERLAGELACEKASDMDIAEIESLHGAMLDQYSRSNLSEYFRINQSIHQKIVEASQNAELAQLHEKLSRRIRRARYMANFSKKRWAHAMEEHEQILKALQARDGEQLGSILSKHLENKFDAIRAWLAKPPVSDIA